MDHRITELIDEWTNFPFDENTRNEVSLLMERGDQKELEDRFHTMLEFGTGGLRGVIGAGTNRMNVYTVGMATQGLANYILSKKKQDRGVVIARDSRRMSDVFSREAARILAGNDIRVYYFNDITPTPLCSFAIRELNAVSGIVITASHNPPEYNGYKVYWDDGGQVVPPVDGEIIDEVKMIHSIEAIKRIDFEDGILSGLIQVIGGDITETYISMLGEKALRPAKPSETVIVYTPLHGTGYKIIPEVLRHFGFQNIFTVESQSKPDENFSTVKSPNPEERDALAQALELARKVDADLILATDPDADRMGVGIRNLEGDYDLLNGNQIGTMLEYYLLHRLSRKGTLPANGVMVKTIVTTDLQDVIARSFSCSVDNVLTGFKWIALRMKEYELSGEKSFIFGGEESYGYLPLDFVRDKDAISSCYFYAEMADWLAESGGSLYEFLSAIYLKFGLYQEDLLSITMKGIDGMERIQNIMDSFRRSSPGEFGGIRVARIADYLALEETDIAAGSKIPINNLPGSDVLQFFLEDGSKITMRPSGTEPKIKFYFSVNARVSADELDGMKAALRKRIDRFKSDLSAKINEV
ncbi:MAG TPA: phospho-sugar mutase [Spirochaetota bacterium]|nr:phospho-sugar mutase [Spirochaetota bacterium]